MIIGATITKEDQSAGRIEAEAPMSLTSWGERLLVEISGINSDALVWVTSKSRMPTTLIDAGKMQGTLNGFSNGCVAPASRA